MCPGCDNRRLGRAQCCLGLIDLRLEELGVDQRDQLAFRYLRIEISVKSFDVARHLTADLHVDNRVERARSRDTRLYQPPFQRYCLVGNRVLRMHPPQFSDHGNRDNQANRNRPPAPVIAVMRPDWHWRRGNQWECNRLRMGWIDCRGHKSRFLSYSNDPPDTELKDVQATS